MSVATQTFGLPTRMQHGGSYVAMGLRLWKHLLTSIRERREARRYARSQHEVLSLAAHYEESMPSFAADLRAAAARR